jgi:plastocyanin
MVLLISLLLAVPGRAAVREVAGCKEADYVAIAGNAVTIEIQGLMYSPKCVKVKPGTSVTIQALPRHRVQGMAPIDGVENPFLQAEPAVVNQTRQLIRPGLYGFWCNPHGDENGEGMAGAIRVAE